MARWIFHKLQTTSHESRTTTTGHMPPFPTPRTRLSCLPRPGVHAARTTKTLSPSSHSSRVTRRGPSRHNYNALRTTHHVPAEADTRVRPYEKITNTTNHRPHATGHMPTFPIPWTRLALSAEIRGPCRKRNRCSVWNAGEGSKASPTGREQKAEHGAFAGHRHRTYSLPRIGY